MRAGAFADRALDQAAAQLDARDRAWTQELVYGTLRLRARLDHRLATFSTRALAQLDSDILDILRLGAYQLTEMHGVAAYAAVSQAVELAKRGPSRGAAGFVNGVLQSLRRAPAESTFPPFDTDPAAHLSTWGSHPRWLVERWIERFGAERARRLTELNNERPQIYVRALDDADTVESRLLEAGVAVEAVADVRRALRLVAGSAAVALDAAPVIVQDPAAGLVAQAAAEPASHAIDVAAAPGGKAIAISLDAAPPTFVAAADISATRLQRLQQNVRRLSRSAPHGAGAVPVYPVVADGRAPPFRMYAAPLVLLDAPCTGTGTLRRHPDGRWRLRASDLTQLTRLQRELLDHAAELVAADGLLVYSTCSLEAEENEQQVSAFLQRQPEFELEPITTVHGRFLANHMLLVTPHDHAFDGAFAARLRRRR